MNKYIYALDKYNNKNVEIRTERSFDYIECENEKEARLFLSFANRVLQNPKYKKVEFLKFINTNEYKKSKGYLLETTPFIIYKNDNNKSWYMYHYPTGKSLHGYFGTGTREDATHNLINIYMFYKCYNKQNHKQANINIKVNEDFLNL